MNNEACPEVNKKVPVFGQALSITVLIRNMRSAPISGTGRTILPAIHYS
jgi:hypothetical protein